MFYMMVSEDLMVSTILHCVDGVSIGVYSCKAMGLHSCHIDHTWRGVWLVTDPRALKDIA